MTPSVLGVLKRVTRCHETRPVTVRTRWLMIGEGGRKDLLSAALMSGPLVLQKLIEGLADDFVTFARSGL